MAEAQVTVDGVTRKLDSPFMIVATQNPIDMEGTYPLPEAQRDRFMARLTMGYPSADAERQMLTNRGGGDPLAHLRPIVDVETLRALIQSVRTVHIAPDVEAYIVAIVRATRTHPDIVLGASPRATLHLASAARAHAALLGRPFVTPDDVAALAPVILAHRLVPVARGLGGTGDDTVREIVVRIVSDTAVPFTATPVRS
jgi:MoxR-like ATPase